MADVLEQLQQRLGGGLGRNFSWATLLKNSDLTPAVQKHMLRVYLTLTVGLVIASAGAVVGQVLPLGPLIPSLGFIGLCTWLTWTPATPANESKRSKLFAGAALTNGLSMAPLCGMAAATAPGVLVTALVATSLVFACFSLSALLARRRSYMYLGAMLSSALSIMLWWRLAMGIFGRGLWGFQVEIWAGLAIFMGYVLVDTQVIVEKASLGDRDAVGHAMQLFLDFVAIFVRVLVLMLRSQERKQQRRRSSRHNGNRSDDE